MIRLRDAAGAMLTWLAVTIFAALASGALAMDFSKNPDEAENENAILAKGGIEARGCVPIPDLSQQAGAQAAHLTASGLDRRQHSRRNGAGPGRQRSKDSHLRDRPVRQMQQCMHQYLSGRPRPRDRETYRVKGTANTIGFHNFVPILQDKPYTAKDAADVMARAQNTIYSLANFYQEIDADLELLGLGLKQKDIYLLPNQDALRYGIHVLDAKTNELIRSETYTRFVKP